MPCCNKQRQQYHIGAATTRPSATSDVAPSAAPRLRDTVAFFQYTGGTGLTVAGPVTGRRYRFDVPGAIVAVDLMDRAAVAGVPGLKQVSNPSTRGA